MQIRGLIQSIEEYRFELARRRRAMKDRIEMARVCGLEDSMQFAFLKLSLAIIELQCSVWGVELVHVVLSAEAGENLEAGDCVKLGEDGKAYRANAQADAD